MKSQFRALTILLAAAVLLASGIRSDSGMRPLRFSGRVTYPTDSGVTWQKGSAYQVQWRDFSGDKVRIELFQGNRIIKGITADNTGSAAWTVDSDTPTGSNF